MDDLVAGVYEALRTERLDALLTADGTWTSAFAKVDPADAPHVLARHVADVLRRAIAVETDPARRLTLVNDVIDLLQSSGDRVASGLELLLSLRAAAELDQSPIARPVTPLSDAALLTNTRGEPALATELQAELASADRSICCARSSCGTDYASWPGRSTCFAPVACRCE